MEAAQPPAPAPAKRIGVGEVISETFSIYGQNLGALLGSALAVFVVVGLASGILRHTGGLILVLLGVAISVAATRYTPVSSSSSSETCATGAATRRSVTSSRLRRRSILPLIGFGILFGIGVAIGFILIVIPGLILLTFWSVGAPAIVVEGMGPIDAFGRSWRLVRGSAGRCSECFWSSSSS